MADHFIPIPQSVFAESIRGLLAPIADLLDDAKVSEVMINGPKQVYVERGGQLELTSATFSDNDALMSAINGIAQYVGRFINAEHPRLDARLPDGSRVHAIIPPAARGGAHLAIRKFSKHRLTIEQLLSFGSLTEEAAEFLKICVVCERNLLVAGGTGSGKTSLLNVMSSLIPSDERIIVIEDSSELQLQQEHVVYLEARPGDARGRGRVTIKELFWSSMRLRPDRVVIGELRGGEALDLVQAMTSGHGGSMSTTHATYPDDTLRRVETMALMSDVEIPHHALREQVASAIQIIVQTSRFNDGSRGLTHIAEVIGLRPDGASYELRNIFEIHRERDNRGGERRQLVRTDYQPKFLKEYGYTH